MMNAKSLADFRKELIAAERYGCLAVREICDEAIDVWGSDSDAMADLAGMILQLADTGFISQHPDGQLQAKNDECRIGTYLMIYQTLCY